MRRLERLLRGPVIGPTTRHLRDAVRSVTGANQQWRRSALSLYSQFLKPGDLVFDVGANMGNRVDLFLELSTRVIAVEPQSSCVSVLQQKYGGNPMVTVVPKAVGRAPGIAELLLSDATTISSMSEDWIEAVKTSGRFRAYDWSRTESVAVTSLDDLVAEYGQPQFVKIDVEGFELDVVTGLSAPIGAMSFEFTPEIIEPAIASIDQLAAIGSPQFNYALGESMHLELAAWTDSDRIKIHLRSVDKSQFGDVYARFAVNGSA